jgi:hypothetical protein
MTSPFEIAHHWWDFYRQRPFGRLIELFVARIFRGGGDTDADGLDLGIGLVLTLLAMPGGFVSLLLLDKYGTFAQWLRGISNVDVLQAALPDEYFFIVLSMVVTGAVAVWRWDAIFPDRRDYINLVPLPIPTRTIFSANLVAVVFLAGLVALDVNAMSCILFPAVVAATQLKFLFFVKFAIIHAIGVLLASIFSFFAVFSLLGLLMALLPPSTFRRLSAYARGVVVVYLVTLLCTTAAVPNVLRHAKGPAPAWTFLLPSCWFLGLCQWMRGRATPAMIELAKLTLPLLVAVIAIAFCVYVAGYRRHFIRIAELSEAISEPRRNATSHLRLQPLLARILGTPFQIAGFSFVWKTLRRSETHRLVLTAVAGLGLVLSSQALMNAMEDAPSARQAALSPDALSIPFILTFLMIVGLRVVFEIPVELRANWLFRLMLDPDQRECERLARNAILIFLLPCVFLLTFPLYAYLEGFLIACLHTLLVATWAALLTKILLVRFRKLPFTCSLPLFKQHSIVILLSFVFGYLIYALSTPEFESAALQQPLRMISLVPAAIVAWLIPHYLEKNTPEIDRRLIFEESPSRTIELLQLGD